MAIHEVTVDELLRGVAAGERQAFARLYAATQLRMSAAVRQVLVDRWQSEEVTQEVFLEIWEKASDFEPRRGVAISWMLTIAKRRAIDRVRSSQASRERDLRDAARNEQRSFDAVLEMIEARFERDALAASLLRITPLQREAVATTYLREYTISEAAAQLGASEKAVRTRVRDGLANLRRVMEASGQAA